MHKVKRAIIMAAGIGKRMQPITLKVPKPLVRVNGERMIDSVIRGLNDNDITEIYIVVGYLKEQFEQLLEEYEGITLLENPDYDVCNNISSLYAAREFLEDAIILDGDQIIYNKDILKKEFERSGYNAIWTDGRTEEWLMQVDSDGIVSSCSRNGGEKGWQLFSVSRWTAEDGKKLKKHLEEEYEVKKNKQIYWDDVAMFCHFEDYKLGIMAMKAGDIVEIDNFDELVQIDSSYLTEMKGYEKRER